MASTASPIEPEPPASRNLRAIRRVVQLTPATPTPLLPAPPIVPATCVPCLWSSIGSHVVAMALNPCDPAGHVIVAPPIVTENADGADQMFAARSGCV